MKPYLNTKDYFYSNEEFTLVYDGDYHMLVTTPTPKNIDSYYPVSTYISHSDNPISAIDRIYLLVKKFSLYRKTKLLSTLHPNKGSILDIGAGTGDFLVAAKKSNWNVTGIEPNRGARQLAGQKHIPIYSNLNDVPDATFDVITLWHVLEHIPNLQEQITIISKLLKSNGTLIIAVPNFKSYDAAYYKQHWAAYDVPRHLWHFSKLSIQKLFEKHNFQLINTKPMWFDSFYVSLLSEKYKRGKNNFASGFLRGLASNLSGLRTKEYSSHIYILKKTK
jgi:2-polyprenyl-3-methyl-5-hydroxy-6-metoxy-1,4-benzoquinol methylase